jgi:UDP-N-acetylmuramoylalanine--D-glutamate ligase
MSQIYRKVAILGLGIEGAALAQFLVDKSSVVEVFDEKTSQQLLNNAEKDLSVQISDVLKNEKIIKNLNSKIENLTISDFDIIFRSPSVYFAHEKLLEARSKGVKISSQIKLFFELCPCKIVGVTGTKGKGTTASLVYEILKKFTDSSKDRKVYLAGNIGYPAISLISKLKQDDIVVLELSNFQLADLDRSPHIAVVTNIGVDHLDYHKSYDEYVRAKLNILKHQANDDYAILNYHSTFPGELVDNFSGQKLYFSKQEENFEGVKAYVHLGETGRNEVVFRSQTDEIKICDEKSIKLVGRHNLENIAAATLAAKILVCLRI